MRIRIRFRIWIPNTVLKNTVCLIFSFIFLAVKCFSLKFVGMGKTALKGFFMKNVLGILSLFIQSSDQDQERY